MYGWGVLSYALDYDQPSPRWPTPCRINDVVSPVGSPSQPLSPRRPALGAHVNWTESLVEHTQVIVDPMKYTHVYAVYCYVVIWLAVWCGFMSSIYPYPPVLFDWHFSMLSSKQQLACSAKQLTIPGTHVLFPKVQGNRSQLCFHIETDMKVRLISCSSSKTANIQEVPGLAKKSTW